MFSLIVGFAGFVAGLTLNSEAARKYLGKIKAVAQIVWGKIKGNFNG